LDGGNRLGAYLRDRRARLDPASFGLPPDRRRTPGLRREEVALRANISPTWYTWLEQGRGGAPSADVLDRIAKGLRLSETEREHLYILGLGHPPDVRYRPADEVSPRIQRVLDALEVCPAIVKTSTWDVVAWNAAAAVLLTDYALLPPEGRNILRLMFLTPKIRGAQDDWEGVARFVVSAFRADVARTGADKAVAHLVEELRAHSADFDRFWRENEVLTHGEGLKRIHHPELGPVDMEFSAFAVDGRPELNMLVYNLTSADTAQRLRALIARRTAQPRDA
jgi:transcriptional regulator with XRE-family HTH domain